MSDSRRLIGDILIDMGCASKEHIDAALERQLNGEHAKLGEILIAEGLSTPDDITAALAEQFQMDIVDLDGLEIDEAVARMLPEDQCRDNHVIPLGLVDGVLTLAVSDPLDLQALDNIRFAVNGPVDPMLATRESIDAAIERYYPRADPLGTFARGLDPNETVQHVVPEDYDKINPDDEAPVVKLVGMLIQQAVQSRASDIHIEPMADRLRVRYRVDGCCYEMDSPPKRLQGAIVARIKIMARMNMAEKRKPQDGKIPMKLLGRSLDLRVSTLPASHGESVVLRILDKSAISFGLEQLGFHPDDMRLFRSLCRKPNGIILITGPTGSGKTTTLYSLLSELNRPDRKIITVEDPVEYTLSGINQCEVNASVGMTFQRALKAMLRQAPNVILIGEIRDKETAHIAVEAALTGHLVLATLHTNDAPSAITRLIDLEVAPFLVASSIQAVVAQRLVRSICPDCKIADEIDVSRFKLLGIREEQLAGRTTYRGGGCNTCHGVGFRGRKGIYEIMTMNSRLREMTFHKATTDDLRAQARRDGMNTLLDDGLRKVLDGWTTLDEVMGEAKVYV